MAATGKIELKHETASEAAARRAKEDIGVKVSPEAREYERATTRLAVVRVRGPVGVRRDIEDTMRMLKLLRRNWCVLIDDRPSYLGMLQKIKDYVTWGEVEPDTVAALLKKRGELEGGRPVTDEYVSEHTEYDSVEEFARAYCEFEAELDDIPKLKPFFRLHPPRGGYERGGIKKPYTLGGALGYRGKAINDLLERMI
nr:50S ribosomal protein L30 [Methanopyrus kandleri]